MAAETSALPYVEAETPHIDEETPRMERWVKDSVCALVRNPGYLLASAAVAGFIAGRLVKRLLFSGSGGSHERYHGRA